MHKLNAKYARFTDIAAKFNFLSSNTGYLYDKNAIMIK